MPCVSPVIDEMADRDSSNHSSGQQRLLIGSRSSDVSSHSMFAHSGGNDDFFALVASESRRPDVDVLLATSEQLGLVSWMPHVK